MGFYPTLSHHAEYTHSVSRLSTQKTRVSVRLKGRGSLPENRGSIHIWVLPGVRTETGHKMWECRRREALTGRGGAARHFFEIERGLGAAGGREERPWRGPGASGSLSRILSRFPTGSGTVIHLAP